MAQRDKYIIALDGDTFEESAAALKAIFSDPDTLACMEARLKNTDAPPNREKIMARRNEALKAFSANPPEFLDMIDG